METFILCEYFLEVQLLIYYFTQHAGEFYIFVYDVLYCRRLT